MKAILLFFVLFSARLFAGDCDLVARLQRYEAQLSAQSHAADWREISALKQKSAAIKDSLRGLVTQGTLAATFPAGRMTDDFDLVDLRLYDWTKEKSRILLRLKSTSLAFTDWVKLYFYFYYDNTLVEESFAYIDFITYGYSGVLPFYETFLESYVNKVQFDSLRITMDYDITDGNDNFLCDQILQQVSNSLTPAYSGYNWEGVVTNASTYSIEFPKIYAEIMHQDSLIDAPSTYLDTECQGDRGVIIDYVTDAPIEAQKIVLRNCLKESVDLGGWYLGDKDAPYAYRIPEGTMIAAEGYKSFDNRDINFTIDQENEIIYLFDSNKNLVDQWTKEENDHILQPLTSSCYNSYFEMTQPFDRIRYKFGYSLHSLQGSGNIAPNAPVTVLMRYELAPNVSHDFKFFVIDGNGDAIKIQVDWGDNQRTGWLGPFPSGRLASVPRAFDEGEYWISARTQDSRGAVSGWSDSLRIFVSNTVPVELADFSATTSGSAVILSWRTLSESNNLGFAVQRSFDKKNWQQIGFAKGRGTSLQEHEYIYKDDLPLPVIVYYRLKQVDFDGSHHFSNIVEIRQKTPARFELSSAHPNPFNATTRFSYRLPVTTTVDVSVYAANGTKIKTLCHGMQTAGEHHLSWHADQAPSGVYFIKVQTDRENRLLKCLLLK